MISITLSRRLRQTVLVGFVTVAWLLCDRSETDSSSVAVYDAVVAKGSFQLDLPNDTVEYLQDAIVFLHDRQAYTVRYRIATEKLAYRIRTNQDRNTESMINRSAEDMVELAGRLRRFAEWQGLDPVLFIGSFVQSGIAYRRDEFMDRTYPRHHRDYYKYGIETLYDRNGDCEDKVILAGAMLKAAGYQTGYVDVPGHLLLAIEGARGEKPVRYDGGAFSIWEMTRAGHRPGDIGWHDLERPSVKAVGRLNGEE